MAVVDVDSHQIKILKQLVKCRVMKGVGDEIDER